jgi:hypothetical protein
VGAYGGNAVLIDPVIDLCFGIEPKVELLLPPVCFLPNGADSRDADVSPLGWPSVEEVSVEKLGLGMQVVLRQRFGVCLEAVDGNGITAQPIEAFLCSTRRVTGVWGNRAWEIGTFPGLLLRTGLLFGGPLRVLTDLSGARSENRQFRRARKRVGTAQIGEFCRLMTTIAVGIYRVQHNEADRQEECSIFKKGFGLARAYTDHLDNGATLLSHPFEPDLEKFSTRLKKVSRPSLLRSIIRDRMRQACNDLRLLFSGLIGTHFTLKRSTEIMILA